MHRKGDMQMPSNNSKYTQEIREQTAKFILETGKSATSVAEEMGIDTNTVCRWVRDYRRSHNMPSYAEEKGIRTNPPKDAMDLKMQNKELEAKLREKEKEIKRLNMLVQEEREKIEILKKSLYIFMQQSE
jgi:transposase-like protein